MTSDSSNWRDRAADLPGVTSLPCGCRLVPTVRSALRKFAICQPPQAWPVLLLRRAADLTAQKQPMQGRSAARLKV